MQMDSQQNEYRELQEETLAPIKKDNEKKQYIISKSNANQQNVNNVKIKNRQDCVNKYKDIISKATNSQNISNITLLYKRFKTYLTKKYHLLKAYYNEFTDQEKIFHYAASLSFYSIFSIIPLCLMLFSIISSFPSFQNQIQTFKTLILDNILPDNATEVSEVLDQFLLNGKEMGFLGFLISLASSFIFFRNFDDVSARIFTAKKRSFFDSFIIYWLLITLIPLFAVTSFYFNTVLSIIYVAKDIYGIMPMIATWATFIIIFRISANKSIRTLVLIFSSSFGASIWYGFKSLFFYYMIYNKFYNTIYGSLSLVMFVFLWIYLSWLVLLISMRICKKLDDRFPL